MSAPDLAALEAVIDASGIVGDLEAGLPTGGRPRQLPVRTLLLGLLAAAADGRPAHLTRAHQALCDLPLADQARLAVIDDRGHVLTYRQVERTFASVARLMDATPVPGFRNTAEDERAASLAARRAGLDTAALERHLTTFVDALVEASVPDTYKHASTSVAVDWTDHASWSRPVQADSADVAADPDASWGHRRPNTPGTRHEHFFGYYAQAVAMVPDENGPPVPELIRRVTMQPCAIDPPTALVATMTAMTADGVTVRDVLADSGYAHRIAERWATPLRRLGARLIQDLHPHDRGPKGTHQGAVCANGNLYCPATPTALLDLDPLPPSATSAERAAHDTRTAELARYKLGHLSAPDTDGYHRVGCPAIAGKLRCPLKPASMTLSYQRPEVLDPPTDPPPCCAQASITIPPSVNDKTRQKHDYPSAAHRASYARRTGVERCFSTLKDPATTDIRRGWCRLMGRTKNLLMLAVAVVVRNQRITDSFEKRIANLARGISPRRKRRRTETTTD